MHRLLTKIKIPKDFISYCLVGVVNTTVSMVTAFVALNLINLNYYVSTALSYFLGVLTSFSLNKKYTFKDEEKNVFLQFLKFNLTIIPIYILCFWFIGNNLTYCYFRYFPQTADFINDIFLKYFSFKIQTDVLIDDIAVCVSIAINLFFSFSAIKKVVFRQK